MSDFLVPPPTGGDYADVVLSGPAEPGTAGRAFASPKFGRSVTLFQPGARGMYSPLYYSVIHNSIAPSKELCSKMAPGEVGVSFCFQVTEDLFHYNLRAWTSFDVPSWMQTLIFKTKIALGIQKWVQTNQFQVPPVSDFFKLLFSAPKIIKKIGWYHFKLVSPWFKLLEV